MTGVTVSEVAEGATAPTIGSAVKSVPQVGPPLYEIVTGVPAQPSEFNVLVVRRVSPVCVTACETFQLTRLPLEFSQLPVMVFPSASLPMTERFDVSAVLPKGWAVNDVVVSESAALTTTPVSVTLTWFATPRTTVWLYAI